MDLLNLKSKKVAVFTDPTIAKLHPLKAVIESLDRHKVNYVLYDTVRVEPTDTRLPCSPVSFKDAIAWSKRHNPDAFVAVGGGSVMDTTKAANLYATYPDADFLDFVNAPIGKGRVVDRSLKPLICGRFKVDGMKGSVERW
ncbi:hypothetical protein BC938DRAFT_482478 [Jimgerdemannia flammicorona]|uniref:Alcohol dehydrogenase iron-type/glycerol dehydrogenase GldA domain-containing protein n=1 Tax=Jimgerdemannia flammicorona TaxID=994334 RepID=A0A433QE25_9FUNG|nr:hypothetical protein BC938DRAFT_482478 [Jimgerdemannia flammicorona]